MHQPPQEVSETEVSLFGGPLVMGGGGAVRLSPYQLALVTLVYGHEDGITRAKAAWMLWEADDNPRVRQRVRQLLHGIGRRVRAPLIKVVGERLRRPSYGVRCDIDLVRDARCLSDAAVLVGKGFAHGLADAIGREYDDWLDGTGLALLQNLRNQAGSRWDEASLAGQWGEARDGAEALYLLDPGNEEAVMRVIEARARAGKLGSAEAAYASYLDTLEADREPFHELVELMRRIRHLSAAGSDSSNEVGGEVRFVGRSAALARARGVFETVRCGRFGFCLIVGESGIGKTRILGELRREAVLQDFRCLHAEPVELERRIPMNPLLDALSAVDLTPHLKALGEPWNAVIGAVLPAGAVSEPTGEVPPIQESSLSRRLLDAFFLLFQRLASERPTVLFLDDLQWADATTIAALQFLQRRWNNAPFGIVATIRADLVNRTDPATSYLNDSDGLSVDKVQVGDLSEEEARLLVARIAEDRIDPDSVGRLCAMAGYHPLFLTELTKDYLAGRLRLPELPADEVSIPLSLQQILSLRLEHLSRGALRVARFLAVGARPMRLDHLAQLTRLPLDDCADCAEELKRCRLVELHRDTVRIAHELFRSALYRDMSEARRAILHRAVGERLLRDSPEAAGELAIHFSRGGEVALAAKYGWIAATKAAEGGAVAEAAYFFELVTENEQDPAARARATGELAKALHLNREITRANPLLELAAMRLRTAGDPLRALRMDIRRVEGLAEVGAAPVRELIERLNALKQEAYAAQDWELVALALDAELHLLHRHEDVQGIRRLFREMRTVASAGTPEAAAVCMSGLALGILYEGADEALKAAHEAVRLTVGTRSHRLTALNRLLVVLQFRGMLELPSTGAILQEAKRLAERSGDLLVRISLEVNLAVAALDAGDLDRAEVLMRKVGAILNSGDMHLNRFSQANNLAELALAQGQFAKARNAYAEAETYLDLTMPGYARDFVNAGLGLCALEIGDLSEARRREEAMSEPPSSWYYDPTTMLTFRVRLLERRNQRTEALVILANSAEDLEDRLVLAWLKVRALQVKLLAKVGDPRARLLATDAWERAMELNLLHRAATFADLGRTAHVANRRPGGAG